MTDNADEKHVDYKIAFEKCSTKKKKKGKKEYGCIGRHNMYGNKEENNFPKELIKSFCDHQWNSYVHTKKIAGDYHNRFDNHRDRAITLGYIKPENHYSTGKAKREFKAEYESQKNSTSNRTPAQRAKSSNSLFLKSIALLRSNPKAFHTEVTNSEEELKKLYNPKKWKRKKSKNKENFLPISSGGLGSIIPYYHNHHHLFSNGVLRDCIIYAEGEKTPKERIDIIVNSNWNINRPENMIVLPQEEQIGKIVGLPAHCPYNTTSHPGYCKKVKTLATDVLNHINNHASPKECKDKQEETKTYLHRVSEKCLIELDKIKNKLNDLDKISGKSSISNLTK